MTKEKMIQATVLVFKYGLGTCPICFRSGGYGLSRVMPPFEAPKEFLYYRCSCGRIFYRKRGEKNAEGIQTGKEYQPTGRECQTMYWSNRDSGEYCIKHGKIKESCGNREKP